MANESSVQSDDAELLAALQELGIDTKELDSADGVKLPLDSFHVELGPDGMVLKKKKCSAPSPEMAKKPEPAPPAPAVPPLNPEDEKKKKKEVPPALMNYLQKQKTNNDSIAKLTQELESLKQKNAELETQMKKENTPAPKTEEHQGENFMADNKKDRILGITCEQTTGNKSIKLYLTIR